MFRFALAIAIGALATVPAQAATFTISGIISGTAYDFAPGPCPATGFQCPTTSPISFSFNYDLSKPEYMTVLTGDDATGYSFTAFLPLVATSPAFGTFIWDGTQYVGTSLWQSQFGFFGPLSRGVSVSTSSYNVQSDALSSAVPEPSTWLLLTAGLGVISWAMRRRSAPAYAQAAA